eukprot:TRINITY_DN70239_c0_g1_i1.p1 TRINITY_DN70239_c0_g1~~TRINITY_DN70239_c0_g1_i1.p1  ORF type:complete len:468 (+),score=115.52 TRINITY_DN70239_c0_g1_i1:90-1406(+)
MKATQRLLGAKRKKVGSPAHGQSVSGMEGQPYKRRLWAGVTKTIPTWAYHLKHDCFAQYIRKNVKQTNKKELYYPDEQLYARLRWRTEDDTPSLLHPASCDLVGYGKGESGDYWNGYHFTANMFVPPYERRPVQITALDLNTIGRTQYPLVPSEDARVLSNGEWQAPERQERVRLYLQKHQIFHIFPDCTSDVNLNVNYGGDDSRSYWKSVHRGNFIELGYMLQRPRVMLPADGLDPEARYTLAMFTPDHPFRAQPEDGHCLHWLVANLRSGDAPGGDGLRRDSAAEGHTVVPYLHPLPSEDAGCLRYIFALFRQTAELTGLPPAPDRVPLARRRHFQLHQPRDGGDAIDRALTRVAEGIDDRPCGLSFAHTEFDYEVAEWYQAEGEPEPKWFPDDMRTELSRYHREERFIALHTPWGKAELHTASRNWRRTFLNYDV